MSTNNNNHVHHDSKQRQKEQDRYYPLAVFPWTNPSWDQNQNRQSSQDMAKNGETQNLINHCSKIYQQNDDTSIDQPWWVYSNWKFVDIYTISVMVLALVPIMLVFWIPLFICLLPPVLLNRLYMEYIVPPPPCNVVPRNTLVFKIHCSLQFLLSIPSIILALGILFYSYSIMTIFGLLYLVVSSLLKCQSPLQRLRHNMTILQPYQDGPALWLHFSDILVAVMGSVYRQQQQWFMFEFMFPFTNMFFVNPWIKYWQTANIYTTDDLGERFITQIGQSLGDLPNLPHDIDTHALSAISRTKHLPANRNEIDRKTFAPHYPYPPTTSNRHYTIGMQHSLWITNLVHTTHYRSFPTTTASGVGASGAGASSLSHSVALPVYRVMLWRNNPYHIYTGYVEANISTGQPNQYPEKNWSLEHPMWLINSHNKIAADRNFGGSLGAIDNFFDDFIPQFNHYIRSNVRGKDVADAYLEHDQRMGYEQEQHAEQAMMIQCNNNNSRSKYQKMAEI